MGGIKLFYKYIDDVLKGRRVCGRLERLTVERTVELMDNPKYYFDEAEAERVLKIISLFRHTKGKYYKTRFQMMPWQAYMWGHIFGLMVKTTGKRLTREVLLCMAKKGGKSEVAGATGIIYTFFDGEARAECYSAANTYNQAKFCWDAGKYIAKQLANDSPSFANDLKLYDSITTRSIVKLSDESFFRPIAADSSTLDGVNPHAAFQDEFHESKDNSIPENMVSGMVLREAPLMMYTTTRGFHPQGPLRELENHCIDVLEKKYLEDTLFPLIFAFDPADIEQFKKDFGKDPDDIDISYWAKSNPGLGQAPTVEGLKTTYRKAMNKGPTAQQNLMVKNFNIWVRQSKSWLDIKHWLKCGKGPIDREKFAGRMAFGAYDLSSKWDLSCKGLLFPPEPGEKEFTFFADFFCPEENAEFRAKRDRVPYLSWAANGRLTLTPGNVVDYEYIEAQILDDVNKYDVNHFRYDPMFATETSTRLSGAGVPVEVFKQNVSNYNEPITKLEEIILGGALNWGACPVIDWMFGNVAIRQNATGLIMFDKQKSREKIDGMVTLAMCFGGYLHWYANNEEIDPNSMIYWG